jgi:hypothetical protein
LGFLTSSNIQYSPWIFSNIQYFSGAVSQYFNIFLVFTNLTIILVVYTIEIRFKKYLGGRGGASSPWHGATHAHAEGTPRVTARGLARFIASLQTLVARASARIRQYTIFVWASGSIFNIFVDLGLNIPIFQYKGVWANMHTAVGISGHDHDLNANYFKSKLQSMHHGHSQHSG